MALPQDLLTQAHQLATREPKRPKQASLRRAVSTAYYALFHFLVDKACRFVVSGASPARGALRDQLARSFEHGVMKSASKAFAGSGTNPWTSVSSIPPGLQHMAQAFVDLQQERHEADYNTGRTFTRTEALASISQAEAAMAAWAGVKSDPATEAYLLSLLARTRR